MCVCEQTEREWEKMSFVWRKCWSELPLQVRETFLYAVSQATSFYSFSPPLSLDVRVQGIQVLTPPFLSFTPEISFFKFFSPSFFHINRYHTRDTQYYFSGHFISCNPASISCLFFQKTCCWCSFFGAKKFKTKWCNNNESLSCGGANIYFSICFLWNHLKQHRFRGRHSWAGFLLISSSCHRIRYILEEIMREDQVLEEPEATLSSQEVDTEATF